VFSRLVYPATIKFCHLHHSPKMKKKKADQDCGRTMQRLCTMQHWHLQSFLWGFRSPPYLEVLGLGVCPFR
jgi:hypothetical protein